MTPQLQQAIHLLQLSTPELQNEIQEALENNIMLEMDEENAASEQPTTDATVTEEAETLLDKEPEIIPDDLTVDWDFENDFGSGEITLTGNPTNTEINMENQKSGEITLKDHLLWQLNLTPAKETERLVAATIIDALSDDGYLHADLDDDLFAIFDDESAPSVTPKTMEKALRLVQSLEPPGVGARSLRECLLIQLRQHEEATPLLPIAIRLVSEYMDVLADKDFAQLMRKLKLSKKKLGDVIALIRSMNPRPGESFNTTRTEYVIPDVFVKKVKGRWRVELNQELFPRLKINSRYAGMVRRGYCDEGNLSLKSHLQEARWFIKSLRSRSETLLRITSCIVEKQRAFLEYGEEAMKPMVLQDVAAMLDLHESTVSRGTKHKYIHTPRGLFELKYFFSSHFDTCHGGATSATAIRAFIKKLIGLEPPKKPLSDHKISQLLAAQGITVARRTVAKYREAMAIPPSNERRKFAY